MYACMLVPFFALLFNRLFIGPRYTWGPIYGSECLSLRDVFETIQVMEYIQVVQVSQVIDSIQVIQVIDSIHVIQVIDPIQRR